MGPAQAQQPKLSELSTFSSVDPSQLLEPRYLPGLDDIATELDLSDWI